MKHKEGQIKMYFEVHNTQEVIIII